MDSVAIYRGWVLSLWHSSLAGLFILIAGLSGLI